MNQITWNLRIIAQGNDTATVYVRKHQFQVGVPVQFDREYGHVTALEYALSALGADLVGSLRVIARRRRVTLENIEAVVSGELNNTLTYLGVVGEEGHPGLERVSVGMYVSSPAPDEEIQSLWQEVLQKSPMVQTLKDAVTLDLTLKVIV